MANDLLEEPEGLYYDYDGNRIDVNEWLVLWQGDRTIQVQNYDRGKISTVWIGLDQGFGFTEKPLIYETMIFGGKFDGHEWRAATREEALENHMTAYMMLRDARGRVKRVGNM